MRCKQSAKRTAGHTLFTHNFFMNFIRVYFYSGYNCFVVYLFIVTVGQ